MARGIAPWSAKRRRLCAAVSIAAFGLLVIPAGAQVSARRFRAGGASPDQGRALDAVIRDFMQRHGVRAGQLAVARAGRVLFERGYTYAGEAFGEVGPGSLFRIASLSKAFTAAVIAELVRAGRLRLDARVFPLLGYTRPRLASQRPDPRINDITVAHLVGHLGGWDIGKLGYDPTFDMRGVARKLGMRVRLSKWDFAHYIYGEPLQFTPGAEEHYSNIGYGLLGLVIEKVLNMEYVGAVRSLVVDPHRFGPVFLAHTLAQQRLPGEVVYDQPGTAPSQLVVDHEVQAPLAYGGELIYENIDSSGGLLTTASTIARMIGSYAVWGMGGRAAGSARSGSMGGTSSWAASRGDGLDFCCIFNTRDFGDARDPMGALVASLNQALDRSRLG